MIAVRSGVKNVSSSNENGMLGVVPRWGYCHRMCLAPSTRSMRLFPRSAISRYPPSGPCGFGGTTGWGVTATEADGEIGDVEDVGITGAPTVVCVQPASADATPITAAHRAARRAIAR